MRLEGDLTQGSILSTLTKLALPIMGTSFIQMAYNLTDIMWLGRLSTGAVAAAGTGGFFLWFGAGLIMVSQIGVGVNVAQNYGKGQYKEAQRYIASGFQLDIVIALIYGFLLFYFRKDIIGFFNLDDLNVIKMAESYLRIIGMGIIFHFLNPIFSTSLNSSGNSITPFKINTLGLITNMILDPILIFGVGPINGLGIEGAAYATIFSQSVVTILFIYLGKKANLIYSNVNILQKIEIKRIRNIVSLGLPPSMQTGAHALISIIITRIIARFGPIPIAVQSIGSQIESITWMTAEGFSAAISAFVGQNYGAGKIDRVKDGYHKGIRVLGIIGIFASLVLFIGAEPIFRIFTPNDEIAIKEGIVYLRILALSQFFMSIEIGTAGAFNGLGKTIPPTVAGISLNTLRIPLALILSQDAMLGLSGIWWSISGTGVIKGILIYFWFRIVLGKVNEASK